MQNMSIILSVQHTRTTQNTIYFVYFISLMFVMCSSTTRCSHLFVYCFCLLMVMAIIQIQGAAILDTANRDADEATRKPV